MSAARAVSPPGISTPITVSSDANQAVPRELVRFFASSGSRTVLIRGPPGSGKSALAARLLELSERPRLWVNTRFGNERWTVRDPSEGRGDSRPLKVADLSPADRHRRGDDEEFAEARDFLLRRRARSAGAEPLLWLPPLLRDSFHSAAKDGPRLAAAVDSWEGLLDHYMDAPWDPESAHSRSGQVERFLLARIAEQADRLVLVTEHEAQGPLDFLVDAVLVTASGDFDDRLVRVLMIPKLSGVAVDETVYPFSLENGLFTYVHRLQGNPKAYGGSYEADPHPGAEGLWPGSTRFQHAFGRLPLGGISLIEREPTVPPGLVRLITFAVAISALQTGGRLVAVLPPDLPPEAITLALRRAVPAESVQDQVRLLTTASTENLREAMQRLIIPLHPRPSDSEVSFVPLPEDPASHAFQPVFPEVARFLHGPIPSAGRSCLVINLDGLEAAARFAGRAYTPEMLPALLQQDVIGQPVHAMVVGRTDDPLAESVRGVASLYLRVLERRGRVFIYGIRPWTGAHVLQPSQVPGGIQPYDLIRMS